MEIEQTEPGAVTFQETIAHLIADVSSVADFSLPIMNYLTQELSQQLGKQDDMFPHDYEEKIEAKNWSFSINPERGLDLTRRIKKLMAITNAVTIFPRGFITILIAQYDCFVGRLVGCCLEAKPEMLSATDKVLTYGQILSFGSLEDAQRALIHKEVESVLRSSHAEQFDWFEKRLGTSLRKDLKVWPAFVELTERRNLFAHADGRVSEQYISKCKGAGVKLDENVVAGSVLSVSEEYFEHSCNVILEISLKLAHVAWRRLLPTELEKANHHFVSLTYDLLENGRYHVCIELVNFAEASPIWKSAEERDRLICIVNKCIALREINENEELKQNVTKTDWDTRSFEFQLARHVLLGQWDAACSIMRKIGAEGYVTKEFYRVWPLFRGFRDTTMFGETFNTVFGESYGDYCDRVQSEKIIVARRVLEGKAKEMGEASLLETGK